MWRGLILWIGTWAGTAHSFDQLGHDELAVVDVSQAKVHSLSSASVEKLELPGKHQSHLLKNESSLLFSFP